MTNKTIISILPRPIWPPYAGQSRLCYFRSLELRKEDIKQFLSNFIFLELLVVLYIEIKYLGLLIRFIL